jgi:hypothetical protein
MNIVELLGLLFGGVISSDSKMVAASFDKVIPDEINEGAAFLASWAWNVSEMPQALPHHAPRERGSE